jgi:hypothetical protein
MNCYDLLVGTGAYLLLVHIAATDDGRWWPWLGLLNKIGVLVFGLALAVGLGATRLRRHLLDRRVYFAGATALLLLLPYVLWNVANDWPTREFIANAKLYKIAAFSPPVFARHNSYWLWGPPPLDDGTVVIAVGFSADELEDVFSEIVEAAVAESPWALESRVPELVCRGPRRPVDELWARARLYI